MVDIKYENGKITYRMYENPNVEEIRKVLGFDFEEKIDKIEVYEGLGLVTISGPSIYMWRVPPSMVGHYYLEALKFAEWAVPEFVRYYDVIGWQARPFISIKVDNNLSIELNTNGVNIVYYNEDELEDVVEAVAYNGIVYEKNSKIPSCGEVLLNLLPNGRWLAFYEEYYGYGEYCIALDGGAKVYFFPDEEKLYIEKIEGIDGWVYNRLRKIYDWIPPLEKLLK